MSPKYWLILMAAAVLIFQGCGKKKQESKADEEFATPQVEQKAEEADIFDEFYDESKTEESAPTTQETFSTSSEYATGSDIQFSESGRYTVQVSCVASPTLASNLAQKLQNKGYPAYTAEVTNPTPDLMGTYYRVRIGGFNGYSKAKSFGEDVLQPQGYEYWVDNKSNDNVGMEGYGLGESQSAGTYEDYSSDYSTSSAASSQSNSRQAEPEQDNSWGASEPAAEAPQAEKSVTAAEPAMSTPAVDNQTASQPEQMPVEQTEPAADQSMQEAEQKPAPEEPASETQSTDEGWGDDDWGDNDWGSESSDSDW
ncbi:MAG: hypothetical protein GF401_00315 [Chitinivibrionales bacterium]|nr:hypothetical protein [Chitinivibrionales bacterium]